jgi:hypothetical protein
VAQVVAGDEADAGTFCDQPSVGDLVVGAEREGRARECNAHVGRAAHDRVVAVVADQPVLGQVGQAAQRRRLDEIRPVRGGDDLDLAELPGDQ